MALIPPSIGHPCRSSLDRPRTPTAMMHTLSFLTTVPGFDANGRRRGVRLLPGNTLLIALDLQNRYDVNAVTASLARQTPRTSVLCGRITREHSALVTRAIRFVNVNGMEVAASVVRVVDESPPPGTAMTLSLNYRRGSPSASPSLYGLL